MVAMAITDEVVGTKVTFVISTFVFAGMKVADLSEFLEMSPPKKKF
jgi:hypothetical protein